MNGPIHTQESVNNVIYSLPKAHVGVLLTAVAVGGAAM